MKLAKRKLELKGEIDTGNATEITNLPKTSTTEYELDTSDEEVNTISK